MSEEKTTVKVWPYVIVGLSLVGGYLVSALPFNNGVANELNTFSAWLCEKLINGIGTPVIRMGTRLQSTGQAQAFHLDFQDGGWILKQIYLLIPLSLFLCFVSNRSLWRSFLAGFLMTAVGLCIRAILLGLNATLWGEKLAAGSLDSCIRIGFVVFVLLAMYLLSGMPIKPGEMEKGA